MQDKLIGYLLQGLEAEELAQVEQSLKGDAEIRRQCEILRLALVPLEGDRQYFDSPPGLAIRTCQRIRAARID